MIIVKENLIILWLVSFNQTVVLWENLEIKKKQQQNFEIIVCKDRYNTLKCSNAVLELYYIN